MTTMQDIRDANSACGHHWFDRDTLRFFSSRLPRDTIDGSRYFVSSEQNGYDAPRRYTLRRGSEDGSVQTIGEFQLYATRAQAVAAGRKLIREGK